MASLRSACPLSFSAGFFRRCILVFFSAFHGSGQTSRVGPGQLGSPDPTRPAKIVRRLDMTRYDP